MNTPNNLEEVKPVQEAITLELTAISKDSVKYDIKISGAQDKECITTSYKNGLIGKEYFSSYELGKLNETLKNLSFDNIHEYVLFLKDFIETNVEKKIENSIIEGNGYLTLIMSNSEKRKK